MQIHTHTHTETNQGLLTVQLQTLMKRVYVAVCRRVSAIDDCLLHVSSSCSLSLAPWSCVDANGLNCGVQ